MSKITKSARDEACTLNLRGVCNYDPATVVWAHSNQAMHGKGMGLKAKDEYGAYACYPCHMTYDRQKSRPKDMPLSEVDEAFIMGMMRSRKILKDKGLI